MPPLKVGLLAQPEYSPWQQLYALVGRLKDADVEVRSPSGRTGDMIQKACQKHELPFQLDGWKNITNWADVLVVFWLPEEEGNVMPRYAAKMRQRQGRLWWQIYPELYSRAADAIGAYAKMMTECKHED